MSVSIDIDVESSVMAEVEKKVNELVAKLQPALEELVEQERQKIIESGIRKNNWLYNIVYDAIRNGVYEAVYTAYTPVEYERRYTAPGGLASRSVMQAVVMDDGIIEVHNTATGNKKYSPTDMALESIILNGGGYHYPVGRDSFGDFHGPRNFYGAAHTYYDIDKVREGINTRIEAKMQTIVNKAMKKIK